MGSTASKRPNTYTQACHHELIHSDPSYEKPPFSFDLQPPPTYEQAMGLSVNPSVVGAIDHCNAIEQCYAIDHCHAFQTMLSHHIDNVDKAMYEAAYVDFTGKRTWVVSKLSCDLRKSLAEYYEKKGFVVDCYEREDGKLMMQIRFRMCDKNCSRKIAIPSISSPNDVTPTINGSVDFRLFVVCRGDHWCHVPKLDI